MDKLDEFDEGAFKEAHAIFQSRMGQALGDYFEDAETSIREIIKAHGTGDFKAVKMQAHTLKSSSAAFGLKSLERLARDIEKISGEEAAGEKIAGWVGQLEQALAHARNIIKARFPV